MTKTLKKQLTALCVASLCGGALMWNMSAPQAQDGDDEQPIDTPPQTVVEAARLFGRLLQVIEQQHETRAWNTDGPVPADSYLQIRLISKSDYEQLGKPAIYTLLGELAKRQIPVFTAGVPRQEEGKTVVEITPNKEATSSAPVVIIREDGGYRVDLVTTYAKRFGLGAGALETAIYKKTDIALEGLPGKDKPPMRRAICQTNLKQIALGIAQYTQDYDEKYPLAKPWTDVVKPYVKTEAIFTCPALSKGQKYGYAYNSKLSNKMEQQVAQTNQTVSLYETSVLKRNAYGVGENRAFRHQNGANYAFADGHVKWFPKTATPSFKLKP
ncbi:MAG TPA: H-X9-DG-CTERM domain-containing protein [Abditibacterium sp.]